MTNDSMYIMKTDTLAANLGPQTVQLIAHRNYLILGIPVHE